MRGRLVIAALRDVLPGGPRRQKDQGNVDQEGSPPRDGVDEQSADHGPEDGGRAGRAGPDTECPALLLAGEVGGQQSERTRHEQSAGGPLQDPEQDEQLHVGRQAAQDRCETEPDQAVEEHALAPVEVAQSPGQDQQGAQRQQVGVVDVRLAFEDAEEQPRELAPDTRQGHVDHRRVQEHDARPQHGGGQDPALLGHPFFLRRKA